MYISVLDDGLHLLWERELLSIKLPVIGNSSHEPIEIRTTVGLWCPRSSLHRSFSVENLRIVPFVIQLMNGKGGVNLAPEYKSSHMFSRKPYINTSCLGHQVSATTRQVRGRIPPSPPTHPRSRKAEFFPPSGLSRTDPKTY